MVKNAANRRGRPFCYPPSEATGATGVFRAATGVAAAPPRGANPSFATEDFRAATGVAAAPQRGANPHSFSAIATKAAKPSARRRRWGRSSARTTTNIQRSPPTAKKGIVSPSGDDRGASSPPFFPRCSLKAAKPSEALLNPLKNAEAIILPTIHHRLSPV